ncbi:MAG: ATP-NAD kinase family protein [Gammaproteobacteria bacterium]|nr:ATP-NAD kinase family protein [Gammaproteobacteria bacterium]
MFKLGLIVNPVAGIGGRVGLKGSDGKAIRETAFERGASALAAERSAQALQSLVACKGLFEVFTIAGAMGQQVAQQLNLPYQLLLQPATEQTEASDTRQAVEEMLKAEVDLLLFAGGDGTARDVYKALAECHALESVSVIGIPAGCKIHSSVYAVSPRHAGELAAAIIQGQAVRLVEADVMDIDEVAFRQGVVKARRYGGLWVPQDNQHMQGLKQGAIEHSSLALQNMALTVIEQMQPDVLYFVGSGSTPAAIMQELGLENSLLGIDLVINHQLIGSDLTEQQILNYLDQYSALEARIIVTVIGGQGIVFGRGNQQLSPEVIRRIGLKNIDYLATAEKIRQLEGRALRLDTGDEALNAELSGMVRILTGYDEYMLYKISI